MGIKEFSYHMQNNTMIDSNLSCCRRPFRAFEESASDVSTNHVWAISKQSNSSARCVCAILTKGNLMTGNGNSFYSCWKSNIVYVIYYWFLLHSKLFDKKSYYWHSMNCLMFKFEQLISENENTGEQTHTKSNSSAKLLSCASERLEEPAIFYLFISVLKAAFSITRNISCDIYTYILLLKMFSFGK